MLAAEIASTTAKPSTIFPRNRRVGSFSDLDLDSAPCDISTPNPRLVRKTSGISSDPRLKIRAEWIKGGKFVTNPDGGAPKHRSPDGAKRNPGNRQRLSRISLRSIRATHLSAGRPSERRERRLEH
jgi:hypothetical protein